MSAQTTSRTDTCMHCDKQVRARGMCKKHWARWRRNGRAVGCGTPGCDGDYYQRGLCYDCIHPRCDVPNCDRDAANEGLCAAHAARVRNYGDPYSSIAIGQEQVMPKRHGTCIECGEPSGAGGWAQMCRPCFDDWCVQHRKQRERERRFSNLRRSKRMQGRR